jgi:hypothetical protein
MKNVMCNPPPSCLGNADPNQRYSGGYSTDAVADVVLVEGQVTINCPTNGGPAYNSAWTQMTLVPDTAGTPTGRWNGNIDVGANRGTGCTFTARLTVNNVLQNVTCKIEDFSILDGTGLPGTINPIPLVDDGPGKHAANKLATLGPAPPGFTYKIFTGNYPPNLVPPITQIPCRIERHLDTGMSFIHQTKSVADAILAGGLWAVIILVPAPIAAADDFLYAELAADTGFVWGTVVQKLT